MFKSVFNSLRFKRRFSKKGKKSQSEPDLGAGNLSGETSSSITEIPTTANSIVASSSSSSRATAVTASNSIHDIHITSISTSTAVTTTNSSSSPIVTVNTLPVSAASPEISTDKSPGKSSNKIPREKKSKKKDLSEEKEGKVKDKFAKGDKSQGQRVEVNSEGKEQNRKHRKEAPDSTNEGRGGRCSDCECIFHKEGKFEEGHILLDNKSQSQKQNLVGRVKNQENSEMNYGKYTRTSKMVANVDVGGGEHLSKPNRSEGGLLGEIIAELDGFLGTSFFEETNKSSKGVWSPGVRNDLIALSSPVLNPDTVDSGNTTTTSTNPDESILPVWSPTTAPSPSAERKFRSVNFNALESPKQANNTPRSSSLERAPSPPKREVVRSTSWTQSRDTADYREAPYAPSLQQTSEQQPFSASQLPKYQNPTITLLQKAREGQLPRGAHYLDHKTPTVVRSSSASGLTSQTRPGSYQSQEQEQQNPFKPNPNEILHEVRTEEGRPSGRRLEFTPRKFDGIGPTTPDGVPLALRSGIKGEQQHEFYRRWYQSLHVDKAQRSGRSPYGGQTSGSWSEPEGYESDSYAYKYAVLDRRKLRDRNFEADYFTPEPFSPTSTPGIRFQPGKIEDYTPSGQVSVTSKAIHRHKPLLHWGLGSKDLGYESDSNLLIRKREDVQNTPPPPPLSPLEQRQVYVDIQKGGDVPLQGLRKPAPDKSRASYFRRVIMPTFEEFKRGISPNSRTRGMDSPRSVRSGSPALIKSSSQSTFSLLQDRIQAKLSRSKSDLNPAVLKISIGRSRPTSALASAPSPSKLIHTSRTVSQIRKNGSPSGIPVRTLSRDTSFEKLGIRSPELTSPREVKKAMATSHKVTVRLEVEKPNSGSKANGNQTALARKSGLKKTAPLKNGKSNASGNGKPKSVKITIDGNGTTPTPSKPPRKARELESLSQSQNQVAASGKVKVIPKVTKVTQVASRHAGCLSPHHSRPTSPGSSLSVSTSLSNLHRGSSCINLQSSSHTLRDRNTPGKSSLTASETNGSRNKLDSNRKKALFSSLSGATSASTINGASTKSNSSSRRKLIREFGDGDSEKEKKVNRLTFPDPWKKSKSDTDSGIGLGEKVKSSSKPQNKMKKSENRDDDSTSTLCVISSQAEKPQVRVAQQKKTNLCSSGFSPIPTAITPGYFTLPGRRKGFHSRDCGYCCYDILTSLDDSAFRSLPALTPYLKETKRVSNSSFLVKNGNRSVSPIPIPTLTSFMRERLGLENRAGVKRSSSLQSLRGRKEYTSYVLELQHSRRKSPRFVQLHRLYSSLERLGQLEKSTSMYDIPILSLEKQLDFDAWWKVRKRIRVDAEIESISSQLCSAQKNREFFFRPRKTEEFRWKGDSALRIKKWSIDELRHFLGAGDWLKKPEELLAYKSAYDLHKTAWRGTSVKEVALNMEVASLSKTRNEFYQEGSLGRFGWLRRAFSMSSTLSDEQRTNIKQRLGTLIKKNVVESREDSQNKDKKSITQGRPIMTSRMGTTTSSALYRTDSGRIIGVDGCMTESVKRQLSRTLSQEIRDRKALNLGNRSLKNSSEGDGESSDHSGKTVIHVPVSTQVLLQKNKYKDSCTKNKIPEYSMYCNNGVPSKVNFFETYYNDNISTRGRERSIKMSKPSVSFSEVKKPKTENAVFSLNKSQNSVSTPGLDKSKNQNQKFDHSQSPLLNRRSRSTSPSPWRTLPSGCSDDKHSYMSHVNVITKLASLLLKRDENLKHLIRREILEHEKLERHRLSNQGEVDRLKYHYETYYPKDFSKIRPEVNLLRCLFCSDPNLTNLTNCHSPHRRCASADIFKEKLMDLCDRAPDGRESSPPISVTPDLYFNSRSRKPIYQPSSTPNVCQPTLTAHCYLESPMTDYGSDISGGLWDYFSESPNTTSLSPTPSANPALPQPPKVGLEQRFRNWNYDPSIHQPKYRYVPPQPLLSPPPPVPPPPRQGKANEMLNLNTPPNTIPHLYRSVRTWNPTSRREFGSYYLGVTSPTRYNQTPIGGYNRYNDNYNFSLSQNNSRNSNSNELSPTNLNLRRTKDEIDNQMQIVQAEIANHRRAVSPNTRHSPVPALASPLMSPIKYSESEVNIHYKAPIRIEEKDYIGEEELRRRQQAAMKKFYEDQRHRKFIQEIQDIENRRHMDNFTPSQKSPIPLNRYEDVIEETPTSKWREKTPEHRVCAKALHNFVAQNARELNFRKGDVLFIRRKLDANWYEGEHNAAVGIFPTSYVEIIQSYNGDRATPRLPSEGQAKVRFNFTAASPAEMSIAKGETIVLTRRVDSNWYEGRVGGRAGIFPVSYVQVLKEPGSRLDSSLSPKPIGAPAARTLIPQNQNGGSYQAARHGYRPNQYSISSDLGNIQNFSRQQQPISNGHGHGSLSQDLTIDTRNDPISYRAIYNYPPAHEDELELRENDVVHVLEKCDDGWYVGVSIRTGLFGTFPGNYVERVY